MALLPYFGSFLEGFLDKPNSLSFLSVVCNASFLVFCVSLYKMLPRFYNKSAAFDLVDMKCGIQTWFGMSVRVLMISEADMVRIQNLKVRVA